MEGIEAMVCVTFQFSTIKFAVLHVFISARLNTDIISGYATIYDILTQFL